MALLRNAPAKQPRPTVEQRLAQRRRPLGYRLPVKRDNASNCVELALPKGPTRHEEKTAKHQAEVEQIAKVRAWVWERSQGYCECCSDTERETAKVSHKAAHEMNELIPRSLTRGLPPAERFNSAICLRMCPPCHSLFHAERLGVRVLDDAIGMDGDYEVITYNGVAPVITVITRPQRFVASETRSA